MTPDDLTRLNPFASEVRRNRAQCTACSTWCRVHHPTDTSPNMLLDPSGGPHALTCEGRVRRANVVPPQPVRDDDSHEERVLRAIDTAHLNRFRKEAP